MFPDIFHGSCKYFWKDSTLLIATVLRSIQSFVSDFVKHWSMETEFWLGASLKSAQCRHFALFDTDEFLRNSTISNFELLSGKSVDQLLHRS